MMDKENFKEWLHDISVMHENDDNGPTPRSLENAYTLAEIMDGVGAFGMPRELQAWESGNGTIEAGLRINESNQFILEASNDGVTGFVRIDGKSTLLNADCTAGELHDALDAFVNTNSD